MWGNVRINNPFWPIFHLSSYIWLIFHLCRDLKWLTMRNTKNIIPFDPDSCNVKKALAMLENICKQLRKHIYTAHMQWNAHVQARENLYYETLISIEDYQMNMEVMYSENPTSSAYSANKLTVAMYPICIEFKAADGTITKGAIKFLSEDRNIPINKFNNLNTGCSWRISPSIKPLDSLQWWVWSPVQVRICCSTHAACNRKLPGENVSIILNPMKVKAVLIVLGQLSNVHLLEVWWSHNRQFVILMTYQLSSKMSPNNPPRNLIFSQWKELDGFRRD